MDSLSRCECVCVSKRYTIIQHDDAQQGYSSIDVSFDFCVHFNGKYAVMKSEKWRERERGASDGAREKKSFHISNIVQ